MDIDWSEIPKGYNWVAQDWDGSVFAYISSPRALSRCWSNRCDAVVISLGTVVISLGNGANPDWRNTKTRRPTKI